MAGCWAAPGTVIEMCFYRGQIVSSLACKRAPAGPREGYRKGSYPGLIGASNSYTHSSASLFLYLLEPW